MHSSIVSRVNGHGALMRSRNQNMSKMWCLLGCDALINGSKNQCTQSIDKEQKPEHEQDVVFARV